MKNFNELLVYSDFLQNQNQNFAAKQILLLFGLLETNDLHIDQKMDRSFRNYYQYPGNGAGYENSGLSYGFGNGYGHPTIEGNGFGLKYLVSIYGLNFQKLQWQSLGYGMGDYSGSNNFLSYTFYFGCGNAYGNGHWVENGFSSYLASWGSGDDQYHLWGR